MSHDTLDIDSHRRDVMKAVGTGGVLAALSGTAAAQENGDDGSDGSNGSDGDGSTDGNGSDGDGSTDGGDTRTVHRVETLITGPATNPDRPADFHYQPTGIHVQPGDVVKWVFTFPDHNVVPYHPAFGMRRRGPTGVTAFSSPLLGWRPETIGPDQIDPPGEGNAGQGGREPEPSTWLYAFETPGVYDILCSPHEEFGMAMRVVVGDDTETAFETSDPDNLPAPRVGPAGLARLTLTDPALEPENVVSRGTVMWEDLEANQPSESSSSG
ncbi:MAG: hypothetical protein ABEJ22_08385 [Haloferacaceae archaeon]